VTECIVTCDECVTEKGQPRKWYWLCQLCAEECQVEHRRDTGHATHLTATVEIGDLFNARRLR